MADPNPPVDPADAASLPPQRPQPKRPAAWQAAGDTKPGRGKMLTVAVLLFCTVAGVAIGVLLLLGKPVAPYFVALPIAESDQTLPPAWAREDTKLLLKCFPDDSVEDASSLGEKGKIIEKLNAIKKGEITRRGDTSIHKLERSRVFLFYIVGHIATGKDTVYLLPNKASSDPASWVKFDDILTAMAECPSERKCLILDVSRPRTNPFTGPLLDDATPALHRYLKAKQDSKTLQCPVLVSTQAEQFSQVIPEEKASAFAFYLAEGLHGDADGYDPKGNSPRDNKVKLQELAHFLKIRVGRWAKQNRYASQLPRLYNVDDKDFDVIINLNPSAPPPPAATPTEEVVEVKPRDSSALNAIDWTERLKLGAEPQAARRIVSHLARWDCAAMRAEQVFELTNRFDPVPAKWLTEARTALRGFTPIIDYHTLQKVALPTPAPAAPNTPPPANPVTVIRSAFKQYLDVVATDGKADAKQQSDAKAKFDDAVTASGASPDAVKRIVWETLLAEYPTRLRSKIVQETLTIVKARAGRDWFAEGMALEQAAALPNKLSFDENAETQTAVRSLLGAENAMAAVLALGTTGFESIQSKLTEADTLKRRAEQNLFAARDSVDVKKAGEELRTATRLFEDLATQLLVLQQARSTADDAMRLLVGTAFACAEFNYPSETDWRQLARSTRQLADQVYQGPNPTGNRDELKSLTELVEGHKQPLLAVFQKPTIEKLVKGTESKEAKDLDQYHGLLATPFLAVKEREELRLAMNKITLRLHLTTRKDYDIPDSTAAKPPTEVKPPEPTLPREQAARRAAVSVALLQLANNADATKCEAALRAITGDDATAWANLAVLMRTAWDFARVEQLKKTKAAGLWPQCDRLGRVYPIGLPVEREDTTTAETALIAANKWARVEEAAYHRWLAEHYRAYGMLRKPGPSTTNLYDLAATECERRAEP